MAHPICHKVISFLFKTQYGSTKPVYNGVACLEKIYRMNTDCQLELKWLIKTYETTTNKAKFFNPFLKTGRNTKTQQQIEDGKSEADIRKSWETGLESSKNES
jgi:hypothetical protein